MLTGNEPVVGTAGPGGDNPGQQPAPQTPAPSDDTTDDLQPINAQQKQDDELKGPTTRIDFGTLQTGEKYRIQMEFINIKNGFSQNLAKIDISVGAAAKTAQIVADIKTALKNAKVPFAVDPDDTNILTIT